MGGAGPGRFVTAGPGRSFSGGEQHGEIGGFCDRYIRFETIFELVGLGYRRDLASATLSENRCGDYPAPREAG